MGKVTGKNHTRYTVILSGYGTKIEGCALLALFGVDSLCILCLEMLIVTDLVKAALDSYTEFISSLNEVLEIYLFGSYAYGEPKDNSDVDLMVVIEDGLDPFKIAFKIQKGLSNRATALDVAVNCRTPFENATKEPTFQSMIKNKGVLLYAKQ
jgi:predicted nucleotidyltransferase